MKRSSYGQMKVFQNVVLIHVPCYFISCFVTLFLFHQHEVVEFLAESHVTELRAFVLLLVPEVILLSTLRAFNFFVRGFRFRKLNMRKLLYSLILCLLAPPAQIGFWLVLFKGSSTQKFFVFDCAGLLWCGLLVILLLLKIPYMISQVRKMVAEFRNGGMNET